MPEVIAHEYPALGLADESVMSGWALSTSAAQAELSRPEILTAPLEEHRSNSWRIVIEPLEGARAIHIQLSVSISESMRITFNRLAELLTLPHGWNSYGARAIQIPNVTRMIESLACVMLPGTPAPSVLPTVRGGAQCEWHRNGIDIEIRTDEPGQVTFFAEDPEFNESDEFTLRGNEDRIREWIQRIS